MAEAHFCPKRPWMSEGSPVKSQRKTQRLETRVEKPSRVHCFFPNPHQHTGTLFPTRGSTWTTSTFLRAKHFKRGRPTTTKVMSFVSSGDCVDYPSARSPLKQRCISAKAPKKARFAFFHREEDIHYYLVSEQEYCKLSISMIFLLKMLVFQYPCDFLHPKTLQCGSPPNFCCSD